MQVVRKQKRSKALLVLLFPAAAVLFLIGWSLTWIGSQKPPRKTVAKPQKNHVHFEAIPLEEPLEIAK